MSITDGQIVFDLQSLRKGIRPAVNVGLSVSRVGGLVQNPAWKQLTGQLFRKLSDYRQAAEFAQFGSELAPTARADLELGRQIYEIFRQSPQELYDLDTLFLMLATVIAGGGRSSLNVILLKQEAERRSQELTPQGDPATLIRELLEKVAIQVVR
jgi:F-type H+-transporting ATPase subunit alpha